MRTGVVFKDSNILELLSKIKSTQEKFFDILEAEGFDPQFTRFKDPKVINRRNINDNNEWERVNGTDKYCIIYSIIIINSILDVKLS